VRQLAAAFLEAPAPLPRQVVNQAERILAVASRKIRLILDDFTTVLYQPVLGFFRRQVLIWREREVTRGERRAILALDRRRV
jgi:hypothetical protein